MNSVLFSSDFQGVSGVDLSTPKSTWISDSVVYCSQFTGVLNLSEAKVKGADVIAILYSKNAYQLISNIEHKEQNISSGISIVNSGYTLRCKDAIGIIFVSMAFFENIGLPHFKRGMINHIHTRLIESLFERLNFSSKPELEILAIANLIGVEQHAVTVGCKYQNILKVIKEKSSETDFNLDALCSLVHMSRRKVQYILSDNDITFLDVLNDERAKNLKYALTENKATPITKAVQDSGFNSYSNAARVFKKKFGCTITDFMLEL